MRYFKAKKGLFQLRYIYGKLRYPVHFVLSGFFCKSFIYKGLIGFFCVVYVHFIMLLLGDKIYFIILDNFSVQAVKVALHQSGGTLIEQGEAVKEGMLYVYTATAAQSSITGSTLTVTVTDLPKNVTEQKQTL